MTENQSKLLVDAQALVSDLFLNKVNKSIKFHNLEHTQGVVMACEEIAGYYQLNDEDRLALTISAWFHDTGFSSGDSHGHEDVSIHLATTFLQEHHADPLLIKKVTSCIEATKMPQSPKNLLEQILCDADLFHLGTGEFTERNKLLREELIGFSKQDISKKQWRKMNISFLENHKYFTDYGKRRLQPVKEKNLEELKNHGEEVKKKKKPNLTETVLATFSDQIKKDTDITKKEKIEKTEREATTVFRIIASNQSNLSKMADDKAHIMISVNSIILSVIVGLLSKELTKNYNLIYPTVAIVATGLLTIVFSILATRPNVTSGKFTREDIQNKKTNLLFFGNFFRMSLPDYDWAMQEMLNDKQYLYSSMIKDNYFLGVVLAKKYRYLRISYNIFMYGLIASMIVFAIISILPAPSFTYTTGQ
ncbi:MAG: Pycsar system effector family protein [Chitinophagales bacterium]